MCSMCCTSIQDPFYFAITNYQVHTFFCISNYKRLYTSAASTVYSNGCFFSSLKNRCFSVNFLCGLYDNQTENIFKLLCFLALCTHGKQSILVVGAWSPFTGPWRVYSAERFIRSMHVLSRLVSSIRIEWGRWQLCWQSIKLDPPFDLTGASSLIRRRISTSLLQTYTSLSRNDCSAIRTD